LDNLPALWLHFISFKPWSSSVRGNNDCHDK